MLIKRVVIDKADRLFQMPPEILDFVPPLERRTILPRLPMLDLGSLYWPGKHDSSLPLTHEKLQPAPASAIASLREDIAAWFAHHHGIKLSPRREIFVGGSITEMCLALSLAYLNHGDLALVPALGLPLYRRAVVAADGEPIPYPVSAKDDWRPDFSRLNTAVGKIARLLFINNPHNPTGTELTERELAELVLAAGRDNVVVICDTAYQGLSGRKGLSLLGLEGGKRVCVELYSFAYNFGLPRPALGFAVGNADTISGLKEIHTLVSGSITIWQLEQAREALRQYPSPTLQQARSTYQHSTASLAPMLDELELEPDGQQGSIPFLWCRVGKRRHAPTLARLLYRRMRILVAPGTSFGDAGQGFVRLSLGASQETYAEAYARIKRRLKLLTLPEEES